MKNLHVKVIVNGESIDKKLKAFTERGLKRKAKAFYNKNEKLYDSYWENIRKNS